MFVRGQAGARFKRRGPRTPQFWVFSILMITPLDVAQHISAW